MQDRLGLRLKLECKILVSTLPVDPCPPLHQALMTEGRSQGVRVDVHDKLVSSDDLVPAVDLHILGGLVFIHSPEYLELLSGPAFLQL